MTIWNNRRSTRILMRCPNGARTLRATATLVGSRTPVTILIVHPHFLGIDGGVDNFHVTQAARPGLSGG